jgi:hypothetical protein
LDYFVGMKSFLAGALVATIVSAGVTYAVASGSTDTVRACAHKKTGDLRIMTGKKCKKSETPVSWPSGLSPATQGATGAKGDTGAPGTIGDTGPQGPAGENGLSVSYWDGFSGGYLNGGVSTYTLMDEIQLPAGTYVVFSNIWAWSSGTGVTKAQCTFDPPGAGWLLGPPHENAVDAGPGGGTISLQTHFVLANDGALNVLCKNNTGTHRINFEGNIYAIAVNSVELYDPPQPCPQNDSFASVC